MADVKTPIETNVVKFIDCCTGVEIYYRGYLPITNGDVYAYIGPTLLPPPQLELGKCYTLSLETVVNPITYPPVPALSAFSGASGCLDAKCYQCPDCYLIIPCDGTEPFVTKDIIFASYLDQFVTVTSGIYNGCAYVTLANGIDCSNPVIASLDGDIPCTCTLQCYYVENSNGFLYVDENDNLQQVSALDAKPFIKVCSKVPPVIETSSIDFQVVLLGDCISNTCPEQCYKLTNCENPLEVIYTNSDTILPYVYGTSTVVNLLNREGCWIASELAREEVCDCPIDITVVASYEKCQDCIGYISYKLTACNGTDIIYTLSDLSAYLGKVIKTDCGCYTIEQLTILPPTVQDIFVLDSYDECIECTRPYWKLEDCTGVAADIITYTDVSQYVGKVIKIENCDECWLVSVTEEHLNATTVVVLENYVDCIACATDLPCICTVLTNYSDKPKTYIYLDCDKQYQEITLQPGESTDRTCAIAWYTVPYCSCFVVKLTISINPDSPFSEAYIVNAIPGEEINGYPVYELCQGPTCGTISFDGTYWVIYDENQVPLYQLTNNQSDTCVIGDWEYYGGQSFPQSFAIETYNCQVECNCITLELYSKGVVIGTYQLNIVGYDGDAYPIYASSDEVVELIHNSATDCWELFSNSVNVGVTLCHTDCPVGTFNPAGAVYYQTKDCTEPIIYPTNFTSTDFFQTFGECQNGVCPHPVFPNNRTVRPGYNTPICTPEKYDMITCNFADILYKIVLEKRYGITNCCPEEDDKWLIRKELIDLQALKDPNYNCPECPCSCNSGKTCATCNCGN